MTEIYQATSNITVTYPLEKKNILIAKCGIDGCTKKLGLIPFKCRCTHEFCTKHRMPEEHKCTFDYKTAGQEALKKANQLVAHDKIIKI